MNIIEYGLKHSRRDAWTDAKGKVHLIEEMNPHHLQNTVNRLRREGVDDSDFHDLHDQTDIGVDEWLSHHIPCYDAMLKRMEEPYVKQFLLEGPHRDWKQPKSKRRRRSRAFGWAEIASQMFDFEIEGRLE